MAVYQSRELRARRLDESAGGIMKKASLRRFMPAPLDSVYDVFLSHSLKTDEEVSVVAADLRAEGLTVYVDRYEDPDMDPSDVSKETAERLRIRLNHSRALVVAYTDSVRRSRWVPWELGFADGRDKRVAVLPVQDSMDEIAAARAMLDICDRQEFLSLYPYVTRTLSKDGTHRLYANDGNGYTYLTFREWFDGSDEFQLDVNWLADTLRAE